VGSKLSRRARQPHMIRTCQHGRACHRGSRILSEERRARRDQRWRCGPASAANALVV